MENDTDNKNDIHNRRFLIFQHKRHLEKIKRRRQVAFFVSTLIFSAFYTSWLGGDDQLLGIVKFPREVSFLVSLFSMLFSVGLVLYFYVQGEPFWEIWKREKTIYDDDLLDNSNADRIKSIEITVESISEKLREHDPVHHAELISNTVEAIKKKAHDEIWHELTENSLEVAELKRTLAPVEDAYNKARSRLLLEVEALGRRGTVNLVFGIITTTGALVVLMLLALNTISPQSYRVMFTNEKLDLGILALMFIPKLSLAIFIQIFSLFFLRLYKSGLSEIKYFQNEITNLEIKYLGVVSAVLSDEDAVREASKALLSVERNHVLSKGQTTIELEKFKIESRSSSEIIKFLPKLFEKKKSD